MFVKEFSFSEPWCPVYDDPPPAEGEVDLSKKTFTQDELNTVVARERKVHESKVKEHIAELEKVKTAKGLTEKEKTDLAKRIEDLGNELLTKEQLAVKDKERLQKEYDQKLKITEEEKSGWENRYKHSMVQQTITAASVTHGAFSPEQIIAQLQPMTRVVEETDAEGKGTGNFIPKVKFPDIDKDKKPIILDLTVPDAVKRMKDLPDKYGNLFKSTATSGLGLNPSIDKQTAADVKNMSHAQYLEWRKKNGLSK